MASLYLIGRDENEGGDIDYSLVDGRVREFKLDGKMLFSEYEGVNVDNWEETLIEYVKNNRLNCEDVKINEKNQVVMAGHHAFIRKLVEDGKLEYGEPFFTFAGFRSKEEVEKLKKEYLKNN